jgi:hypothetical protein
MPRKRTGDYTYQATCVDIRSDLFFLKTEKKWNLRKIVEEALLAKVTPEDLAYAESFRLTKELEKQKKIIEQSENKVMKI